MSPIFRRGRRDSDDGKSPRRGSIFFTWDKRHIETKGAMITPAGEVIRLDPPPPPQSGPSDEQRAHTSYVMGIDLASEWEDGARHDLPAGTVVTRDAYGNITAAQGWIPPGLIFVENAQETRPRNPSVQEEKAVPEPIPAPIRDVLKPGDPEV